MQITIYTCSLLSKIIGFQNIICACEDWLQRDKKKEVHLMKFWKWEQTQVLNLSSADSFKNCRYDNLQSLTYLYSLSVNQQVSINLVSMIRLMDTAYK